MKYLAVFFTVSLLASCGSMSGAKYQSYQGEQSSGFSYGNSDKPLSQPSAPNPTDPGYRMDSGGRPVAITPDR